MQTIATNNLQKFHFHRTFNKERKCVQIVMFQYFGHCRKFWTVMKKANLSPSNMIKCSQNIVYPIIILFDDLFFFLVIKRSGVFTLSHPSGVTLPSLVKYGYYFTSHKQKIYL